MLRILHLFYEILLGSEQLQNMILLYLDIILYTRKTLLSTILLLFTRCATSNAYCATILTFLSQSVIITAEIVFEILQNYTLTESQQFHIEQLPRQNRRTTSLYLFKT